MPFESDKLPIKIALNMANCGQNDFVKIKKP